MLFEERTDLGDAEGEDNDDDEEVEKEEENPSHAEGEDVADSLNDEAKGMEGATFGQSGGAKESGSNEL